MFVLFVARNFRVAYKQTILGPLWFIITPVLSVIVYATVFGGIANIPTDGIPPILFYLLGISVWGYFSSCLSATSNSFVSNADIFGKVYFPRIIMPLVAVTTNLLSLAIQLAIFAAFYIYYAATGTELVVHWQIVLFPFLIILLALMAVGFGMIFSSMTTKYRDLQIMLNKIISLWVYITPVIYPLSMVTNEKLHLAMSLNPLGLIVIGIAAVVAAIVVLIKNWDRVKEVALNCWSSITESFTNCINRLKEMWESFKSVISAPINAVIRARKEQIAAGQNATGTSYFPGGWTHVNEGGRGELINLPSGSQIIPNSLSKAALAGGNQNINITVNVAGNVIGNDDFYNECGRVITERLTLALGNM